MKDQQPKPKRLPSSIPFFLVICFAFAGLFSIGQICWQRIREWDIKRARLMVYAESQAANLSEKEMSREQLITAMGAITDKYWACQRLVVEINDKSNVEFE